MLIDTFNNILVTSTTLDIASRVKTMLDLSLLSFDMSRDHVLFMLFLAILVSNTISISDDIRVVSSFTTGVGYGAGTNWPFLGT